MKKQQQFQRAQFKNNHPKMYIKIYINIFEFRYYVTLYNKKNRDSNFNPLSLNKWKCTDTLMIKYQKYSFIKKRKFITSGTCDVKLRRCIILCCKKGRTFLFHKDSTASHPDTFKQSLFKRLLYMYIKQYTTKHCKDDSLALLHDVKRVFSLFGVYYINFLNRETIGTIYWASKRRIFMKFILILFWYIYIYFLFYIFSGGGGGGI